MTPLLETSRLRLRPPGLGDARRLADYLNNFAVSGNLARVPYPYALDDAHIWLSSWRADAPPADTSYILELRGEGAVGAAGFRDHDGIGVLGYWLAQPFWGQGLMTEALCAIFDWYFATTEADHIVSGMFHFNMASAALQMKFGFVETGRSVCRCLARGQELEHIDTELTREAFELSRPKPKKIVNS